jgi:hypothetical protein
MVYNKSALWCTLEGLTKTCTCGSSGIKNQCPLAWTGPQRRYVRRWDPFCGLLSKVETPICEQVSVWGQWRPSGGERKQGSLSIFKTNSLMVESVLKHKWIFNKWVWKVGTRRSLYLSLGCSIQCTFGPLLWNSATCFWEQQVVPFPTKWGPVPW